MLCPHSISPEGDGALINPTNVADLDIWQQPALLAALISKHSMTRPPNIQSMRLPGDPHAMSSPVQSPPVHLLGLTEL